MSPMNGSTEPKLAPHLRDLPRAHRGPRAGRSTLARSGASDHLEGGADDAVPTRRPPLVRGLRVRIPDAEPVWRVYDQASRAENTARSGRGITDNDAPGHLICMLDSALVCPFWRTPGGRLGRDSMVQPGASRGDEPAILGFNRYGLLIDPGLPINSMENKVVLEGYVEEITFSDPLSDLAAMYDRERKLVGGRDVGRRRVHYAPQFGGLQRMHKDLVHVRDLLHKHGPDSAGSLDGQPVAVVWGGWAA